MKDRIYIILIIIFQGLTSFGQLNPVYFTSWKKLNSNKSIEFLDKVHFHHRTLNEIRVYGGNDYELLANQVNMNTKTLRKAVFAVQSNDTLYLNGEKIKLSPFYCKVLINGPHYLVFNGSISNKEQNYYDDLISLYGASGGFEAKLVADANEKRILYYLDKRKRKPKVSRVDTENMKKLLENQELLYEEFIRDKDNNKADVLFQYMIRLNQQESGEKTVRKQTK